MTEEELKQFDYEVWELGCYLRQGYFGLARRKKNCKKLPYKTQEVTVGLDKCLLYDIPIEDMQKVLDELNPYGDTVSFPINECSTIPFYGDAKYYFRDAKIIYYNGCNFIVPPIFFSTGATPDDGWGIDKD